MDSLKLQDHIMQTIIMTQKLMLLFTFPSIYIY